MENKAVREEEKHILLALDGSQTALRWLYDAYKKSLFLICLRYCSTREEAEDMLQNGFIQIFNELSRFDRNKGSFYTWSSKIMVNICLQELRKKKIQIQPVDDPVIHQKLKDDFDAIAHLSLEETLKTLQKMPSGYRTIFNLYHIEGYNHKEIADMLSITVSTSKTQLMKSKVFAKKLLTNEIEMTK